MIKKGELETTTMLLCCSIAKLLGIMVWLLRVAAASSLHMIRRLRRDDMKTCCTLFQVDNRHHTSLHDIEPRAGLQTGLDTFCPSASAA